MIGSLCCNGSKSFMPESNMVFFPFNCRIKDDGAIPIPLSGNANVFVFSLAIRFSLRKNTNYKHGPREYP